MGRRQGGPDPRARRHRHPTGRLLLALVGGCALPGACGGDPAAVVDPRSVMCGQVSPCGGSVLGSWRIGASCVNDSAPVTVSCSSVKMDTSGLSISGSFTYNNDGTYAARIAMAGVSTAVVPASCLVTGESCQTFAKRLISAPFGSTSGATTCTTGDKVCNCTVPTPSQTVVDQGKYQTSGTTLAHSGGTVLHGNTPYCVDGTSLHLISRDPATRAIRGDFVLIR